MRRRHPNRVGTGGTNREVSQKFVDAVVTLTDKHPVTTRVIIRAAWPNMEADDVEVLANRIMKISVQHYRSAPWNRVVRTEVVTEAVHGSKRVSMVAFCNRATYVAPGEPEPEPLHADAEAQDPARLVVGPAPTDTYTEVGRTLNGDPLIRRGSDGVIGKFEAI